VLVCNLAIGQDTPATDGPAADQRRDPTTPSAEILSRLRADMPTEARISVPADVNVEVEAPVAPVYPQIVLKGLVFSDPDHGSAMLESAGCRVTVRLDREDSNSRLAGFTLQGIEFQVLDFTDRTLLLQAPDRTLLVP
jgi:hypothetical protein